MHYIGMSGYRTAGVLAWDSAYVAASVVAGAVFATAALVVGRPGVGLGRIGLAGGLLTLGIVGMHFTGMTAVTIIPDLRVSVPPSVISNPAMGAIAVAVTALILIITSVGSPSTPPAATAI